MNRFGWDQTLTLIDGHVRPTSKPGRKYDDAEPRDDHGRWTSGGGGGSTAYVDKVRQRVSKNLAATTAQVNAEFSPDVQKTLSDALSRALSDASPWVRIDRADAVGLLTSGRFMSQSEVNDSHGALDPQYREEVEANNFGWTAGAPYTIYGYLGNDDVGSTGTVEGYGEVRVRLKDDVLDRTTFTVGDSLDSGAVPSFVREPSIASIDASAFYFDSSPQTWSGVNTVSDMLQRNEDLGYVEAQFHGGVTTSDIEEVVIPASLKNDITVTAKLVPQLESSGVKYRFAEVPAYSDAISA